LVGILGRRRTCLLGWSLGLALIPAIAAGALYDNVLALHAAHCLLGIHQGITWATNIVCLMDLLGPGRCGLASGLSNASGYFSSAVAAPVVSALFEAFGGEKSTLPALVATVLAGILLVAQMVETQPWAIAEDRLSEVVFSPGVAVPDSRRTVAQRCASFCGCSGVLPALYDLAGLTVNAATGLVWGSLVIWCQETGGLSTVQIGFVESAHTSAKVVAMVGAGYVADRCIGSRLLVALAMGCLTGGLVLLMLQARAELSWQLLYASSCLIGAGVGSAFPALAAAVAVEAQSAGERASAYCAYRMWRDAGYALGGLAPRLFGNSAGCGSVKGGGDCRGFQETTLVAFVWSSVVTVLAFCAICWRKPRRAVLQAAGSERGDAELTRSEEEYRRLG